MNRLFVFIIVCCACFVSGQTPEETGDTNEILDLLESLQESEEAQVTDTGDENIVDVEEEVVVDGEEEVVVDVEEEVVVDVEEETIATDTEVGTLVSDASNATLVSDNNGTLVQEQQQQDTLAPTTAEPTKVPTKFPSLAPSLSNAPSASAAPTTETLPPFGVVQNETLNDNQQNETNTTSTPTPSPTPRPTPASPTSSTTDAPVAAANNALASILCEFAGLVGGAGRNHNDALDEAEIKIGNENPVDTASYLRIVEDQARAFCKGDEGCEDGLGVYTDAAIEYVERDDIASTQRSGGRRRLADDIPNNNLNYRTLEALESVLLHITLETEFEVITALEGFERELMEETSHDRKLAADERHIVDAAISVAKASTAYWHKAHREDESNTYRRLQRANLIDCLFTGNRDRNIRRNLRMNLSLTPIDTSLPQQARRLKKSKKDKGYGHSHGHKHSNDKNNEWMDPCAHCDSWQRCEQCYSAYNLNGQYHYNYNVNQGYNYGNMGHNPGYGAPYNVYNGYGGHGGYGGYGGRNDDFFFNPNQNMESSDSSDETDSSVATPEDEGALGAVGNFLFNVAYVVRADVVGVIVGVIIGQGCLVPAVASAFLFSALYAICYRRTN